MEYDSFHPTMGLPGKDTLGPSIHSIYGFSSPSKGKDSKTFSDLFYPAEMDSSRRPISSIRHWFWPGS